MNILAFMGFAGHDPAACVLKTEKDGTFQYSTISEERLNRVKYSYHFPLRSIHYCMEGNRKAVCRLSVRAANNQEACNEITRKNTGYPVDDIFGRRRRFVSIAVPREVSFVGHALVHQKTAWRVKTTSLSSAKRSFVST